MFDYQKIAERLDKASNSIIGFLKAIDSLKENGKITWEKTIKSARRQVKLKQYKRPSNILSALCSLGMGVFSSFSICLFHHMHTVEGLESYYTDNSLSLAKDIIQKQVPLLYVLIPFLTILFFISFWSGAMHGIASKITAVPLAFNMIVSLSMEHSNFRQIFLPGYSLLSRMVLNLTTMFGFWSLITTGIGWIFFLIDRRRKRSLYYSRRISLIHLFFISVFIIIIGWTPGLYMCYPGTLRQDTLWQIESFMGVRKLDASNPILTTVFYGWLFSLGRQFGSDNFALFKIVVIQAFCNACIMGLVTTRVYKYTKSIFLYALSVLFYGFTPAWQIAAQQALKDVIHTGWYLLFYLEFMNCIDEKEVPLREIVWLCFCAIILSFTRKAAFYLAVLCIGLLIICKRKQFYHTPSVYWWSLLCLWAAIKSCFHC